jgi:hypothetical protein
MDTNNTRIAQISNLQLQPELVERAGQEVARLQGENNVFLRQIFEGQLRLSREIMQESDRLAPLALEAAFAAKQEFGIKVEEHAYTRFLTESNQRMRESARRSLDEVERRVAQIGQPSAPANFPRRPS